MIRRITAIVLLLVALLALEAVADQWFLLVISIALIAGPFLQWAAFTRLRGKHIADKSIKSLRSAMFVSFFAATISTILAGIAGFVVLREIGVAKDPLARQTFIVLLAWALLILTFMAIEWLRLKVWPVAEAPE